MQDENNIPFDLGELPEDANNVLQPTWQRSPLSEVLSELNNLVEIGIINDYAIGGGYASIFHGIPYSTFDLDVLLILANDDDFHNLYEYYLQKGNEISEVYIYISGTPVQFLPNISPLFTEAVINAQRIELNSVPAKVVTIEYLIVLLLKSFRVKDKIKIVELIKDGDIIKIKEIIGRFDDQESQLSNRLREFLADS